MVIVIANRLAGFLLAPLIVSAFAGAASAAEPAKPADWTPAVMMKVKRVGSVQVSPDGKQVVFAVRQAVMDGDKSEYLTHLYLADAAGGHDAQLTQGDKSCDDPQWSPDGAWIAFVSARSGKKNLWVIRPGGGEAQQVSDAKTGVGNFKWAPDGKTLAFTDTDPPTAAEKTAVREKEDVRVVDENVKMSRLYVVPFTDPPKLQHDARLLTKGALSVVTEGNKAGRAPFDWSPDGKTIVVSHAKSPAPDDWPSADLSLIDVASGKMRPLVHTATAETTPLYSPDGESIAYSASDDPPTWADGGRVCVVPAAGGKPRALAETSDGWGRYSELVGWSADGQQLYLTEAQHVSLRLMALPLDGPPHEVGHDNGMSASGIFLNARRTHFGFAWERLDKAPEAFVAAVERFTPVQVSHVQRDLPDAPPGSTDVVHWQSNDGLEIEGLLTYPVGYEKGKKYPLLLIIHGGPMGAFMQSFDGTGTYYPIAAFASKGYAVLRANPRGSTGYGKKFRYANHADWGGGDFADLMAGVDFVIDQGVADADRLGVMGWSYGGYMTSWTITQTHRFRAASVGAGVTNLMTFNGTADIPGFLPDYFGGEFWDKPELYQDRSPMFHVRGVTTPTLILHGEIDERVPLTQDEELYEALKRQGCTTKMVVYPRTHHGIEEPRLMVDCMNRNLEWFDKYVRSDKGAKP